MLHLRVAVHSVVGAVRARVPSLGAFVTVLVGVACTLGGSCIDIVAPHVFLATAVRNVNANQPVCCGCVTILAPLRQTLVTRRAGEGSTYVAARKPTMRACLNSILKRLQVLEMEV